MSCVFPNPLPELAEYDSLERHVRLRKGPCQVSGCSGSQKVHLLYTLGAAYTWTLVVTHDETQAKDMYEDFRCFTDRVWLYPARDLLFYAADIHGNLLTKQRIQVLRRIWEGGGGIVVTTVDALMDHLPPPGDFAAHTLHVEVGQTMDLDRVKTQLVSLGYERMGQVEAMGQFSIRGSLLDVYPLTEEQPVRIELWDDEVDSIRCFDLENQRSNENLEAVDISPAAELLVGAEALQAGVRRIQDEAKRYEDALKKQGKTEESARIHRTVAELAEAAENGWKIGNLDSYVPYFMAGTVSFLDYFEKNGCLLVLDDPNRLREHGEAVEFEFTESMKSRLEKGYVLPGQSGILFPLQEIFGKLLQDRTVMLTTLEQRIAGVTPAAWFSFQVKSVTSYQNNFEQRIKDLRQYKKEKYRVVLLCGSRTRASHLAGDLREYEISAFCPDDETQSVKPGELLVTHGSLHRGFEYPLVKFVVMTEGDLFGTEKKRPKAKWRSYSGKAIQSFHELSVGDYVVHEDHGLGIYRGIEKVVRELVTKDYLKIEYGDGGNLYVPATRLDSIQKYSGGEATAPKLNNLNSDSWKRTKERVRGAVQEIARELVELYAARQDGEGFMYGPDTVWQKEFEEVFPFEETQDQLDAIEDVKRDMEAGKIMDRLICGDVGYGKTEIALRAAFKAVQENKQVAYLVPTTILAQQHYNTFVQRMKDFPVRVDLMSRFRSAAQQKKTLSDLKKGMVDIVIGTHRLLSADVKFKELGLLIIDEEQRFGVRHKEKIKRLKETVDVLTLTATPIPRTLHMSLVGIRDMSLLEEPPVDRVPVQTYVMEYNDEMVREAIRREIARGGQVYYVFNRIVQISDVAARVQALVPDATVVYAHGQMEERQLERIMVDFVGGDIDVLVTTTIIETGLDIPNANTMIIHDADRMGLSQLYQLRGRVGRSNRTAYAFFMYRRDKLLREEAEKRLQAIKEFTELGSGIKIAMRDLEIRGAGNVLGAQQHGHMEAVGYDLYCKMLRQAVRAIKHPKKQEEDFETVVECDIDAYIPAGYIPNEYQKLDIYKRICAIETPDERSDMEDELIDRFGDVPDCVENLLRVALLKSAAHQAFVTEVAINRQEVRLTMYQKARLDVARIPGWMGLYPGQIRFLKGDSPGFLYQDRAQNHKSAEPMMEVAARLLEELRGLVEEAPGELAFLHVDNRPVPLI